jgi:hypothetical protein
MIKAIIPIALITTQIKSGLLMLVIKRIKSQRKTRRNFSCTLRARVAPLLIELIMTLLF